MAKNTSFIIVSPPQTAVDHFGKRIGTEPARALFYNSTVGRSRIYRASKERPHPGLKMLVYKSRAYAEKICQRINEAYNDTFEVKPNTACYTVN